MNDISMNITGSDFSSLPRIITRKELRLLVPFTPQHILRLETKGTFPKRIPVGARRVGWWLHEVVEWIKKRSAEQTLLDEQKKLASKNRPNVKKRSAKKKFDADKNDDRNNDSDGE